MNIWREAGGLRYLTVLRQEVFRMVESQSYIATRQLVDSLEEQALLEEEIEKSKPRAPKSNSRGALHYLLFTPFRYPPLRGGGRFHTRFEQSIFYGSTELPTAMAEIAWRRFLFLAGSEARLEPANIAYTHFAALIDTSHAIALTEAPFEAFRAHISNPASYADAQPLGSEMRECGVLAFTFFSARSQGVNVGLFSPEAFALNAPLAQRSCEWNLFESAEVIEFHPKDLAQLKVYAPAFRREGFYVDGVLPMTG